MALKIFHGLFERWNVRRIDVLYNLIKSAELNWDEYISQNELNDQDPIKHYLNQSQSFSILIPDFFDSDYYIVNNQDVLETDINPLVHYLKFGMAEGRPGLPPRGDFLVSIATSVSDSKSGKEVETETEVIINSSDEFLTSLKSAAHLLDWSYYIDSNDLGNIDPFLHYRQNWVVTKANFPGFFDEELYLSLYPDIRKPTINPLLHYIHHGKNEGRIGWLKKDEFFEGGNQSYDPERNTIIVVSHESTTTGAPVVALEVARRLGKFNNIITVTLRKGGLHDDFLDAGFLHVNDPKKYGQSSVHFVIQQIIETHCIEAVIVNSVESMCFLEGASNFSLPTVSLLHEYAEYTRPIGKISSTIYNSDIVIFPARSLKNSGLKEMREKTGLKVEPNHIWVQPQGSMRFNTIKKNETEINWSLREHLGLDENALIIAGAGHIQPRKGVDWFLESCAQTLKILQDSNDPRAKNMQFVWLGDGFEENDLGVSVWLETYMQRRGIRERCHFPGHVDSVSTAFKDVDIYLLTSRLDPFPNVAIDAMDADCGIGCFEGASGVAEFVVEHRVRGVVAPYGDCRVLAELVVEKLDFLIKKDGANTVLCNKFLCFDAYIEVIKQAMQEARRRKDEVSSIIDSCVNFNEKFDARFYGMNMSDVDSKRHFLSMLQKGIVCAKPFPGSDVQTRQKYTGHDEKKVLIDYVSSVFSDSHNNCSNLLLVNGKWADKFSGSVALQFHVYYNDLIPEYAKFIGQLSDHKVDLYISYVHPLNDYEIELLRDSVSGELYLNKFQNVGRDVYPFHMTFLDKILDSYDIVGHMHTKKSLDVADNLGDRWRKYLLQNLIGSKFACRQILAQFNDPAVGLVYAEDRHLVDEGENMPFIDRLLSEMEIEQAKSYFEFPIGTMFWARVEALKPLGKLKCDTFKLAEPVPYDGSALHAFERLVPVIVKSSGYKVRPVYTPNTVW